MTDLDEDDGARVDEEERRRIWRESNIGRLADQIVKRRKDLLDRLDD